MVWNLEYGIWNMEYGIWNLYSLSLNLILFPLTLQYPLPAYQSLYP